MQSSASYINGDVPVTLVAQCKKCAWSIHAVGSYPEKMTCPRCKEVIVIEGGIVPQEIAVKDSVFHQLWNELHREVRTPDQYEAWLARIPSFGCSCRNHWKAIAGTPTPEQIADPWWGFEKHNEVNAKLNKPILSRQEAAKIYNWSE